MRAHIAGVRQALVLLLLVSAGLFLAGSTIERSHRHHESSSPAQAPTETGGEEGPAPVETHAESGSSEAGVTILGINTESLALSIVAVVASLLLAIGIWIRKWPRLVLLGALGFGLVFAVGDTRELLHQLDESNAGLALVAGILIALHLAIAALAVLLLRSKDVEGEAEPAGAPS